MTIFIHHQMVQK